MQTPCEAAQGHCMCLETRETEFASAPRVDQNAKVAAETAMTEKQKRPAMVSASRCTGASRACAAATSRPMPASVLPAPVLDALTVMGASNTTVPAVTCPKPGHCLCERPL